MLSFVLVHIGENNFPIHVYDCITQLRFFHKNPIYLILNKGVKNIDNEKIRKSEVEIVYIEDLSVSNNHKLFSSTTEHDKFYKVTEERFFVLEDFLAQYNLQNVVHLESDNLIYYDWNVLYDCFDNDFDEIIVPRDCSRRCIASVMFIKNVFAINRLNIFLQKFFIRRLDNEMFMLGKYFNKTHYRTFPVVYDRYEEKIRNLQSYCYGFEKLGGVFDAAAIGQFVGGVDRRPLSDIIDGNFIEMPQVNITPFVNPDAVYQIQHFNICWVNNDGLYTPAFIKNDRIYRIYNLHVHSKELSLYRSDRYKES